tara:strand:- start:12935 stop:14008 length:1074 start_codon:yes stop_codon:yes gene_type:complete
MAFTTINKSSLYHNTILYTDSGAVRTLTGVGFQPDFTWIKTRNHGNRHNVFDSVRGATKGLSTDKTDAEYTQADTLTAFTSDGFSLGADASGYGVNYDNKNEVAWCWKAGTTSGIATNGSTTITPSAYSFNQTSGISIVKFAGNGTAGAKVAHGLGAVPEVIILKALSGTNSAANGWNMYHHTVGNTKYMLMNVTDNAATATNRWNDTTPDSVNFTLGSSDAVNVSDGNMVAYCFASVSGYSKMGSYVGNGNADGTFVYTGFKPAWIMFKGSSASGNHWQIYDTKRNTFNVIDDLLRANQSNAENTNDANESIDVVSNGFKCRGTSNNNNNHSGVTYIYMAFGQTMVSSGNICATAR